MDIFTAIFQGRIRQINNLLQDNSDCVHARTHDKKTPLLVAVCESKDEIRSHLVRLLIRQGSDINAQDAGGRTALMYASMDADKIDLVRILSRCKECDPNIRDEDGNTAAIHAIMCANSSAIKVFVNSTTTKSSMNLELRNKQGLTPLELSVKLQMTECCKILVCEGGANTKSVKNQVGLMRLLEDENLFSRTITPHSRNPSRNAFVNWKLGSPILENRQMEGAYMSRDTTPNYVDEFPDRAIPTLSRSNSLHRTNSNLYKRRQEVGSRPSSFSTGGSSDILGYLQSQRNLKRVLTPISGRNGTPISQTPELGDDKSMSKTRLPSIPSGRKLYLVSNNDFNRLNNASDV